MTSSNSGCLGELLGLTSSDENGVLGGYKCEQTYIRNRTKEMLELHTNPDMWLKTNPLCSISKNETWK